ncbi:BAHD1 protein, partial [Rhinopomastus cyanomelas]|nr:BAHD1 protein [Rhinopomastus cyanomelas]
MTPARQRLLLPEHPAGCAGQASVPTGTGRGRMDGTEAERGERRGHDTAEAAGASAGPSKSQSLHKGRKSYPLRRRPLPAVGKKTCKVLLTRLEDVAGSLAQRAPGCGEKALPGWMEGLAPAQFPEQVQPMGAAGEEPEPRKRRLASLNAEAVNNLLFERDNGLPAGRRLRRDSARAGGDCPAGSPLRKAADGCPAPVKAGRAKGRREPGGRQPTPDELSDDGAEREDEAGPWHAAPKRLASLNAAAFLKLSREKEQPLRARGRADGEGRCPSAMLKRAGAGRKSCLRARREAAAFQPEGRRGWRGAVAGTGEPQDCPGLPGEDDPAAYESPSSASAGAICRRLPLLMGGQAAMKPEYGRPGERSPAPKQELHQPSFPVQRCPALPVPGNHVDCGCLGEAAGLTPLGAFDVCYGRGGGGGYAHHSACPRDELSPAAACQGLPFRPLRWCESPRCCGEGPAVGGYGICGLLRVPEGRLGGAHAGRGARPYKMPFAAEGCKSLDQLNLTIPVAGHPASPAHPLSGCPVPSVPPAAEPVPHLQTPNSDPQSTARECPQSAKPPSGSKSGLRSAPGCLRAADGKAAAGHPHPKQPRIGRRRATNGWIPVGTACEKAVYVVNEPEPAVRKSYQAVERDGEIIRVRDTVLLKSGPRKKSMPYVAKISALWEDPKTGELMMSLLWYYRPEHTQGGRNPSMHQNEIFASRHQDENSVACIEEKCYVLTFAEYCRFCALAKRRVEGIPGRRSVMVPPSEEYSTPLHRKVPEDTDPELVFLCRHVYDFRHGRILKNPQ